MTRVQIEIFIGTVLILATSLIVLIYGLNEEEPHGGVRARPARPGNRRRRRAFRSAVQPLPRHAGHGHPGPVPAAERPAISSTSACRKSAGAARMEDYIVATASSGRLVSTRPQTFPGEGTPAMPSFSQSFGGPLREDQIRNIAAFIVNWEQTATVVEVPEIPVGETVGTDITKAASGRRSRTRRDSRQPVGLHGLPCHCPHRSCLAGDGNRTGDRDARRDPLHPGRLPGQRPIA